MATLPYEAIVASRPFRFLVGPNKKEYMIHADLIAHLSPALNTLVNGKLKEAREGVAEWPHVEEATFVRFSQYVYTGDYINPSFEQVGGGLSHSIAASGSSSSRLSRKAYSIAQGIPETVSFYVSALEDSGITGPGIVLPISRTTKNPSDSRAELPVSHAKLYVLADTYGIESLAKHSCYQLARTLIGFKFHKQGITGINELIRYSFENTVDKGGKQDLLRSVICITAACQFKVLWADGEFRNIYQTTSEFMYGVMNHMLKRMD